MTGLLVNMKQAAAFKKGDKGMKEVHNPEPPITLTPKLSTQTPKPNLQNRRSKTSTIHKHQIINPKT